mmetsp:Transcript_23318/g.65889  ORF Transcript_23318/g.65889 Transcript_23318/m.65889 type:complete len:240 (-) Transcript_23318:576-1295(-)
MEAEAVLLSRLQQEAGLAFGHAHEREDPPSREAQCIESRKAAQCSFSRGLVSDPHSQKICECSLQRRLRDRDTMNVPITTNITRTGFQSRWRLLARRPLTAQRPRHPQDLRPELLVDKLMQIVGLHKLPQIVHPGMDFGGPPESLDSLLLAIQGLVTHSQPRQATEMPRLQFKNLVAIRYRPVIVVQQKTSGGALVPPLRKPWGFLDDGGEDDNCLLMLVFVQEAHALLERLIYRHITR